jgi:hypothetical protein
MSSVDGALSKLDVEAVSQGVQIAGLPGVLAFPDKVEQFDELLVFFPRQVGDGLETDRSSAGDVDERQDTLDPFHVGLVAQPVVADKSKMLSSS